MILNRNATSWLEFESENVVDTAEIMARIQAEHASRTAESTSDLDVVNLAEQLRLQMLGDPTEVSASGVEMLSNQASYDIMPQGYKIEWRIPIIGPIHGLVRRVINAEIQRFLFPSLLRQSELNRRLIEALEDLATENERLRVELSTVRSNLSTEQPKPTNLEAIEAGDERSSI